MCKRIPAPDPTTLEEVWQKFQWWNAENLKRLNELENAWGDSALVEKVEAIAFEGLQSIGVQKAFKRQIEALELKIELLEKELEFAEQRLKYDIENNELWRRVEALEEAK